MLIKQKELKVAGKFKMMRFKTDNKICVLGKYTGETFEGSDRLSMAIAKDFEPFHKLMLQNNWLVICEGDRFTNSKFIEVFRPFIIRIKDSGEAGRKLRGSTQTERHIRAIETRVSNIKPHLEVEDSLEALKTVLNLI